VLGIPGGGQFAQHFAVGAKRAGAALVLGQHGDWSLMVPAGSAVLARMVTPARYLDRG